MTILSGLCAELPEAALRKGAASNKLQCISLRFCSHTAITRARALPPRSAASRQCGGEAAAYALSASPKARAAPARTIPHFRAVSPSVG